MIESGAVRIGWYWERVELENYLIDPVVVQRALGDRNPSPDSYRFALQSSAESIAEYTAARTALSLCRRRFVPLRNAWGRERGADDHPFPDDRSESDCRRYISTIIKEYAETQMVQECEALEQYDRLLAICKPGGYRFERFLTFFSGKDLLFGMESALTTFGFDSPFEFRERVLKGIERTQEDVWQWLPEWIALKRIVTAYSNHQDQEE